MHKANSLSLCKCFFLVLLCYFFCPHEINAQNVYFVDNFDVIDEAVWRVNSSKELSDLINNGWLNLEEEGNQFPLLCRELDLASEQGFEISVKFKYNEVKHWGSGIILGNLLPPYPVDDDFYPDNDAVMSHFQIWQDSSFCHKLILKNHFSQNENIGDAIIFPLSQWHDLEVHEVVIRYENNNYLSYLDGQELDLENHNSYRIPEYICIGNATKMDDERDIWSTFQVDHVIVRPLDQILNEAVVVVPGLSASWNTKAMVLGQEVDQSEWNLIPFAKPVYQRLYQALEQNGYTSGEDLFLWPYDWRQPVTKSAEDLAYFIENNEKLKSKDKINLIGHSLGGMVSRQWSKDNQNKVGKIVTVGSPHQGAVQAYQALAGGKIGEQRDLEWVGMELLVHINRRGFQTDAEVIKSFAPVLNDLTPTFDYLYRNGQLLSAESDHNFLNNYLIDLNTDPSTGMFINQASFIAGNMPDSTPEQLTLKQTGLIDRLLNLWPDGKPYQTKFGIGDQTVLRTSSYLGSGNPLEFSLEHKELVYNDQPLEDILKEVGISNPVIPTVVPDQPLPSASDMLIFYLASPAVLKVENLTTGQIYTPEDPSLQMVYIDYPGNISDYQAKLTGTANGVYHLYLGQLTPQGSFWQTYQGEINLGEEKDYLFQIKPNQPEEDPLIDQTGRDLLELALFELRKLNDNADPNLNSGDANITSAITNVDNQSWLDVIVDIKKTLNNLSEFRKELLESEISKFNHSLEISQLLVSAWQKINQYHLPVSSDEADSMFKKAVGAFNLGKNYLQLATDRNQSINNLNPASLKFGDKTVRLSAEESNQQKYFLSQPNAYFGINLGEEAYLQNPTRIRQPR